LLENNHIILRKMFESNIYKFHLLFSFFT